MKKTKALCKTAMPEPIGTLRCRLEPNHKGPCSYKGFFTSDSGVRVCLDVAWTSPRQIGEQIKREKETSKFLYDLKQFRKESSRHPIRLHSSTK
jgi:hypothetical protein